MPNLRHSRWWRDSRKLASGKPGAVQILVRLVWVMGYNTILRWTLHRFGPGSGRQLARPTAGGGLIIAWCGMRGIVTLATALALPDSFTDRDIIVFCALGVVLGTLVLQGMTLRPLMQRLRLPEDNSVQEETALARRETAQAATAFLRKLAGSNHAALLLDEYVARAEGMRERHGGYDCRTTGRSCRRAAASLSTGVQTPATAMAKRLC